jgi:alpha-D-xyloside xylohydrolase
MILLVAACATATACSHNSSGEGTFEQTVDGIVVTPAEGAAKKVRLQVMADNIVRVTAFPDGDMALPQSLMIIAAPSTSFELAQCIETMYHATMNHRTCTG